MGESILWDLKYKQIGILLGKNSNNCDILTQLATIYKGGKEMRLLQEGGKECELT